MEYSLEEWENCGLLKFKGRISSLSFPNDLEDEIVQMIEADVLSFIVDLEEVDFVDSSGLSLLLQVLTKTRNAGGESVLCNVNERIATLLIITKLNTIFLVAEDREKARDSFLEKVK